jgi:hypothetical protein
MHLKPLDVMKRWSVLAALLRRITMAYGSVRQSSVSICTLLMQCLRAHWLSPRSVTFLGITGHSDGVYLIQSGKVAKTVLVPWPPTEWQMVKTRFGQRIIIQADVSCYLRDTPPRPTSSRTSLMLSAIQHKLRKFAFS